MLAVVVGVGKWEINPLIFFVKLKITLFLNK